MQFLGERLAGLVTPAGNDNRRALSGKGEGGGAPDAGQTSDLMNSASEPKECSSLASALPASSRRPATTTVAPFLAKAKAAARPMPVRPPVINTTGVLMIRLLDRCTF